MGAALCSGTRAVWHDPQCGCVSNEELLMLQALADACERQRMGNGHPSAWWCVLVPSPSVIHVDDAARCWLRALQEAGVSFPQPRELIESLGRLESIAGPAGHGRPARLN